MDLAWSIRCPWPPWAARLCHSFLLEVCMKKNGIKHIRSAPGHPATNGEAECFVQTFKRALKTGKKDEGSLQTRLSRFYLCTTLHLMPPRVFPLPSFMWNADYALILICCTQWTRPKWTLSKLIRTSVMISIPGKVIENWPSILQSWRERHNLAPTYWSAVSQWSASTRLLRKTMLIVHVQDFPQKLRGLRGGKIVVNH